MLPLEVGKSITIFGVDDWQVIGKYLGTTKDMDTWWLHIENKAGGFYYNISHILAIKVQP